MVAPLGYEVKKSGYNQFGQGGDFFLVKDGKRYKPPRVGRQQRDDKFYQEKVKEARSKGIKDALIYDYLRRKEKLPVKKIKELFEIDSILLGVLPESFKSIEGGAKAGLKLFLQVEKKLGDLKRKNKTLKEPLSEREITDQVFEFFMGLPAYKKAADKTKMSTTQAQMLVDLQKALDEKISTDLLTQLKNSREIIRQRTKGISDIKKLQQELINFMRRNLPRTSFTKSEAINLIRKIQQVNSKTSQANLENLMEEVMDVVVTKNNRILLSKINKLLAKKYEAVVSGRKKAKGVDVDTNARIKRIKNSLFASGISVEKAQEQIDKLNAELFAIGLNEESTDEDFAKATDIQIALNYNKAMLMEMDDMYTTDLLLNTLSELETLIKGGRQELQRQLELANRKYRNDIEIGFESITGEKVDMQAPDYKTQLEKRQTKRQNIKRKEKSDNFLRKKFIELYEFIRYVNDSFGFGAAEAMEGLMDRLDVLPGEMFGGNLQELITNTVDASTRKFKQRMLIFRELMTNKLVEIYGKNYEEVYRDFEQTDNSINFFLKKLSDLKHKKPIIKIKMTKLKEL